MKPIMKVITDEVGERRWINYDKTRFCLISDKKIDIWNPREAQEIANFINQNNGEYQRELKEKRLQGNIEKLGG